MLTHKYSPKSLKEIYGQNLALEKLKYNVQHKIPTILHGSTGTGKTSSVYALASELNFELAAEVRDRIRKIEELR